MTRDSIRQGLVEELQPADEITRFYRFVSKSDEMECWIWTGTRDRKGYGRFTAKRAGKRASVGAHRFSFERFKGEIPQGFHVCHACDNPSCVNPDHLWAGTPKENDQDCCAKGRKIAPARRKIDRSEALTLRAQGWSYLQLADHFSVAPSSISRVLRPLGWGGQISLNQHSPRLRAKAQS